MGCFNGCFSGGGGQQSGGKGKRAAKAKKKNGKNLKLVRRARESEHKKLEKHILARTHNERTHAALFPSPSPQPPLFLAIAPFTSKLLNSSPNPRSTLSPGPPSFSNLLSPRNGNNT